MKDHKIWNSDLGKVFIERQDREVDMDIKKGSVQGLAGKFYGDMEREHKNGMCGGVKAHCPYCERSKLDFKDQSAVEQEKKLGRGGQAIDKMINGPINKEYDGMIKAEKESDIKKPGRWDAQMDSLGLSEEEKALLNQQFDKLEAKKHGTQLGNLNKRLDSLIKKLSK